MECKKLVFKSDLRTLLNAALGENQLNCIKIKLCIKIFLVVKDIIVQHIVDWALLGCNMLKMKWIMWRHSEKKLKNSNM